MKRDFEGCQKEFYSSTDVTYKQYFYNGKLYYLNPRGICRSNEDGTGIELVVEIDLSECYNLDMRNYNPPEIMVNSTGIYFYDSYIGENDRCYKVSRYSFDGKLINELSLDDADCTYVKRVYIYKTKIFYTSILEDDTYCRSKGFCVDIETGEKRQFCKQAKDIVCIYGTDKYVVIRAMYKNELSDIYEYGWYLFNFETEQYICLSSDKCPPHLILSHPEYFDGNSDKCIFWKVTYDIFCFDFTRGIMWVKEDGKFKPKTFLNGVKDIDGIPEWSNSCVYVSNAFFNGEVLFNADRYYSYSAYDREGNKHSYQSHDGHGFCDYFAIHNNLLYMQIENEYPEQYKIENGEIAKLRNCWFKEEPRETRFGFNAWDDSDL